MKMNVVQTEFAKCLYMQLSIGIAYIAKRSCLLTARMYARWQASWNIDYVSLRPVNFMLLLMMMRSLSYIIKQRIILTKYPTCVLVIRALKRLWRRKLRPCLKKRCSRKVDEVTDGPRPMPTDWEIEHNKPDLEDFTFAEYTEKVILYGFIMVSQYVIHSKADDNECCIYFTTL